MFPSSWWQVRGAVLEGLVEEGLPEEVQFKLMRIKWFR